MSDPDQRHRQARGKSRRAASDPEIDRQVGHDQFHGGKRGKACRSKPGPKDDPQAPGIFLSPRLRGRTDFQYLGRRYTFRIGQVRSGHQRRRRTRRN